MRVVGKRQRRRITVRSKVFEVAAVDTAVVEHHEGDGQLVAAGHLHFHTIEAECGIAADVQHFLASEAPRQSHSRCRSPSHPTCRSPNDGAVRACR